MLIDKLRAIHTRDKKPSILVIGDLMIDHYIWGNATRLSPEAPVPIVNVKNESTTLGGAANVAQNLISLGAKVTLAGLIGDDTAGDKLIEILKSEGIATDVIIKDAGRPTTLKTRVLVGSHQLVRIDREVTKAVTKALEDEIINKLTTALDDADIVILSDYNKGLFSAELTRHLITACTVKNKRVVVDPKGLNYAKYHGAYLIKPNRKELAEAAKVEKIQTLPDLQAAAKTIFAQTQTEYLVVTLSEEGMVILGHDSYRALPVKATEVFDVTGAGDTVIAAIAYFMACGLSIEEACELANHAAAIVIRQVGSATTTINEILKNMGS